MKAILFYFTAILTVVLLCMEINLVWIILAVVDISLIAWCYNNISVRALYKYSGYSFWYKFLKADYGYTD